MSDTFPIALISGASRGIGLETGRQLLALGWRVSFGMRSPDAGRFAKFINAAHGIAVPLDVTDAASCDASVQQTLSHFGRIDSLINNAGIDYDTDQNVLTPDIARARACLDTNLWGAWQLATAAAPALKASRGTIVNLSSGAGQFDGMGGGTPAYSVSKAALNALTVKLAAELSSAGVRVNAVCPGWTATDMGGGGRPVADGAKGVVWAATLKPGAASGGFFRDGKRLSW